MEYTTVSNIDKDTAEVLTKSELALHKAREKTRDAREASLTEFHRDLSLASTDVRKIAFNDENKQQGYSYTSASKILQKVNEALAARGIAVIQVNTQLVHSSEVVSKSGTKGMNAVVSVSLTLGRGSHQVTYEGLGQGQDYGDKAIMKANTAAVKYALAAGLLIAWEKADPEADESTDQPAEIHPRVQEALDRIPSLSYSDLQVMKPDLAALRGKPGYDLLRQTFNDRVRATKPD